VKVTREALDVTAMGIMGGFSLSEKEPIKRFFEQDGADFIGTKKYSDWCFVFIPPVN